jgi:hypothetical protein
MTSIHDDDHKYEQWRDEQDQIIYSDESLLEANPQQIEPEIKYSVPMVDALDRRLDAILAQYSILRTCAFDSLTRDNRERFLARAREEMVRTLSTIVDDAIRRAWVAACEYDGIDPDAPFVIHSDGNPHVRRLSEIVAMVAARHIRPSRKETN